MTEREVSPEMIEAYMRFCANRAPDHNEIGLLYFDAAWQASRQQALTEAAAVCVWIADDWERAGMQDKASAGTYLADQIRSLTSPIGDKA